MTTNPNHDPPGLGGSIELADIPVERVSKLAELLSQVFRKIMQLGTDYGTTPGTKKPSLWKAGAELLCRWLSLSPILWIVSKIEDTNPDNPYFDYTAKCDLQGRNGFVGSGLGSANTRESRYAWRWVQESQLGQLDRAKLQVRTASGRTLYRAPTPPDEIFTLKNTVLKMACKRAFVDAVLRVTGASRIFTQDLAEEEEHHPTSASSTESIPAATSESTIDNSEKWTVSIPVDADLQGRTDVRQIPLAEGLQSLGVVNVSSDMTEAVIIPAIKIAFDEGPVQHFLLPKILEPMQSKHQGTFQYRCNVDAGILGTVLIRGSLDETQVKELAGAAKWCFSKILGGKTKN
jgi:hypothetical protein